MTDEVAELAPRLRRFSIEIAATPGAVYECWCRFEKLPRFRESRNAERAPGHRLAWCTASGSSNTGWVELSPLPSARTRLELCLNYQPNGFLERVADAFGWIDAGIRRDLRSFGRFAESASNGDQL